MSAIRGFQTFNAVRVMSENRHELPFLLSIADEIVCADRGAGKCDRLLRPPKVNRSIGRLEWATPPIA